MIGKYYGFPQCCIDEFESGLSMGQTRKFEGTGYIPCENCNENVGKELLIESINKERIHPESFPEDGSNNFNENVFRMFFSDKYTNIEKNHMILEWDDILEEICGSGNTVDSLFFEKDLDIPKEHTIFEDKLNVFGKQKLSSVYEQDAQLSGKIIAAEFIKYMKDVNNQPFGFSWDNIYYVREFTFDNYIPFDGKEPKNIIELEDIAMDASVIEWKKVIDKDAPLFNNFKVKKYNKQDILQESMVLIGNNFYNIFIKDVYFNEPNLNVFLNTADFEVRIKKALDYTRVLLKKYLSIEEADNALTLNNNLLIGYYSRFL